MQWNFQPYVSTTISGTGKFFAGIIITIVGVALYYFAKYYNRYEKNRRLNSETRTERLLDSLSRL
jgi:hypothetical protein